jgi:DNA polymerase III delta subunit
MNPSYTVWKLLDDLWQAKTGHALLKLASLLKDEPSGISLSALLRQQWATIGGYFENAQAAHKKNLEAVAKRLGKERWKQGLIKIHQAQIDLRSSKPPQAVLERLLIGLMQLQQ